MEIRFFVPGIPKPGGSKRVFTNPKTGKPIMVDMSKNKDWKASVSLAAKEAMNGRGLMSGPLAVEINYYMPRPKYHYRANGQLKGNAPVYHEIEPDADKLTRSTQDAMTGVVWRDDGQIAILRVIKFYDREQGLGCGAGITVRELQPAEVV